MTTSKRSRAPWTDDEEQTLRRMHAEGASDATIAEQLGRSIGATTNQRRVMGLPSNNPRTVRKGGSNLWTDKEDAILRRLFDAGRTDEQIAPELGRSANACRLRRHFLGVVDPELSMRHRDTRTQRARESAKRYQARMQAEAHDPSIGREQRIANARAINELRRQEAFRLRFGRDPSL